MFSSGRQLINSSLKLGELIDTSGELVDASGELVESSNKIVHDCYGGVVRANASLILGWWCCSVDGAIDSYSVGSVLCWRGSSSIHLRLSTPV